MTASMKFHLRRLELVAPGQITAEFVDTSTNDPVLAEFHYADEEGVIFVKGSEPDVLQWCLGSAEDVRRVHRAVAAFAEAAAPSGR